MDTGQASYLTVRVALFLFPDGSLRSNPVGVYGRVPVPRLSTANNFRASKSNNPQGSIRFEPGLRVCIAILRFRGPGYQQGRNGFGAPIGGRGRR